MIQPLLILLIKNTKNVLGMSIEEIAEKACGLVKGNVYHRRDVGTEALLQKRVDHMKSILDE